MAWKAQHRLHARYAKLLVRGIPKQRVITAVGRELLGFIWGIGVATERSQTTLRALWRCWLGQSARSYRWWRVQASYG
jgi:hypothetical protein